MPAWQKWSQRQTPDPARLAHPSTGLRGAAQPSSPSRHAESVPLLVVADISINALRQYTPGRSRVLLQEASGPYRASQQLTTAVRTLTRHRRCAIGTEGALKAADHGRGRGGQVAVATFTIGSHFKHAGYLGSGASAPRSVGFSPPPIIAGHARQDYTTDVAALRSQVRRSGGAGLAAVEFVETAFQRLAADGYRGRQAGGTAKTVLLQHAG